MDKNKPNHMNKVEVHKMKNDNKQIFMQMPENKNNSELKIKMKDESKEQSIETALGKLTDAIDLNIANGVATISMPEPVLAILTSVLKKILEVEKNLDRGIERC